MYATRSMQQLIRISYALLAFLQQVAGNAPVDSIEDRFRAYLGRHGMAFSDKDFASRIAIFKKNLEQIAELKTTADDMGISLGETPFLHLSNEEFALYVRGNVPKIRPDLKSFKIAEVDKDTELPAEVDWSAVGAVTPVKNQGSCGGCWAFSATGAIESAYYIKHGAFPGSTDKTNGFTGLSEQQLLDCNPLSFGCNGGWPVAGYVYSAQDGGLAGEEEYPYRAINYDGAPPAYKCQQDVQNSPMTSPERNDPFTVVNPTIFDYMTAVAQQPLSVEVSASLSKSFCF